MFVFTPSMIVSSIALFNLEIASFLSFPKQLFSSKENRNMVKFPALRAKKYEQRFLDHPVVNIFQSFQWMA
jgi:hypothetical protein